MILLDTHVLVWAMLSPEMLSGRAREAIVQARMAGERLRCSPLSLYEIARAVGRKKLRLNTAVEEFLAEIESRVELVPVTARIAACAADLPEELGNDPVDRMLVATAMEGDYTLVSYDERIRRAGACKVLW